MGGPQLGSDSIAIHMYITPHEADQVYRKKSPDLPSPALADN